MVGGATLRVLCDQEIAFARALLETVTPLLFKNQNSYEVYLVNGDALQETKKELQSIERFLREKGNDGWELIGVGRDSLNHSLFFKRPIVAQPH